MVGWLVSRVKIAIWLCVRVGSSWAVFWGPVEERRLEEGAFVAVGLGWVTI